MTSYTLISVSVSDQFICTRFVQYSKRIEYILVNGTALVGAADDTGSLECVAMRVQDADNEIVRDAR